MSLDIDLGMPANLEMQSHPLLDYKQVQKPKQPQPKQWTVLLSVTELANNNQINKTKQKKASVPY